MKIIFIELCNFIDYPIGGHLSRARHLSKAMEGSIDMVGVSTNLNEPVGSWFKKELQGFEYNFYNVYQIERRSKKPLIPGRIQAYFNFRPKVKDLNLDKYDIIIIQTPEVLISLPERLLPKVILIMPGVSNPLSISRYSWARKFQNIYDKIFFKYAKKVRCLICAADSLAIEEFLIRSKGTLDRGKVYQFPTRFDADIFHPKDKWDLRQNYQISMNQFVMTTVGRLNWFKGWKFMIDCMVELKKFKSDIHLFFVGDGEDHLKIEEYIKENQLESIITLLGQKPLDIVSDYICLSDCYIMGSYKEGWSTSLVEAVSCNVPCVVTNFSSAHDMVVNGQNGFVIESHNVGDFVKAIIDCENLDPSLIFFHSKKAYDFCSVQTMKAQFEKIINENF